MKDLKESVLSINDSIKKGYKVAFYIGEFDFENSIIENIDDLPEDYESPDKNIYTDFVWAAIDLSGDPIIRFNCIKTKKEYEVSYSEYIDRISYSMNINPGGKIPEMSDIFSGILKIAKKHKIPIEFIGDKNKC